MFEAAEKRIRSRIEDLVLLWPSALRTRAIAGGWCCGALTEAEGLCELAENALRRDWMDR